MEVDGSNKAASKLCLATTDALFLECMQLPEHMVITGFGLQDLY